MTWLTRVCDESIALGKKIEKLTKFLTEQEKDLATDLVRPLKRQRGLMTAYLNVLNERIGSPKTLAERVEHLMPSVEYTYSYMGRKQVMCTATLNGYVLETGEALCLHEDDYVKASGEKYALEDATMKTKNTLFKILSFAEVNGEFL